MEVVVTTGAIRRAKLQSNHRHQQTNTQLFTDRMPFLSPNQQCQRSTEGKTDSKDTRNKYFIASFVEELFRTTDLMSLILSKKLSFITSYDRLLLTAVASVLLSVCLSDVTLNAGKHSMYASLFFAGNLEQWLVLPEQCWLGSGHQEEHHTVLTVLFRANLG